MKKISIFFSFLFLFLVAVSSDSFAQVNSGVCSGTQANCSARSVADCTVGGGGCALAAGVCGVATPTGTCAGITNRTQCIAATGCTFTVSADANNNAFVDTLCNALKIVTGSGGKAFAAFAIISVGIGFFTGKVSWGLMIGITAGIAAMFGAPTIVAAISGGSAVDCAS